MSRMTNKMKLYLASSSPRRQELLAQLELPFGTVAPEIDESRLAGESAVDYVQRMAKEKAAAGLAQVQAGALVLAADTVVVLDGQVLGKPASAAEAAATLRQLSGRSHQVMTAFALQRGQDCRVQLVSTEVRFAPLSEADIAWYWSTGEQQDKAGGYGIQGKGGIFVEAINGSYSNVVGLPLAELKAGLQNFGL